MTSVIHAAFAVAGWAFLWRGLERSTFVGHAPDPEVASAFALAVLVASALGSVAAAVAGRTAWSPLRAFLADAVSFAAAAWAFAVISLGPWSRDLGGVVAIAIVVVRVAPGALAVVSGRAPAWLAVVVAFGGYAAAAAWLPVASLPFGDQIHYLLFADQLARGSLAVGIDADAFTRLLGIPPSPDDVATHVANTDLGPRPIQGYALPLLILPGWAVAGRVGAGLVMALAGAWTSWQILLILRDLMPARPRVAGWTWLIASACAPLSLLATHVYPNVVGAALIATAYRAGWTAPVRRPALAAATLALTVFLTPRDAVPLLVLLPFLLRDPATRLRAAVATALVALVAVVMNAALYGVPVPYAGYAFGTAQAQEVTRSASITLQVWVTLQAILFDRTFGLAGSAPWVFAGLVGLIPALRADRGRLLPAALAVGISVLALAFFRLWEGGYAPPARYFVDVLPLWTPFVAYGLVAARGPLTRAVVGVLVGLSVITSLILNAVPSLALNSAFDDKIRDAMGRVLGVDPLAWLPSFQPVVPDWYVVAYLSLVPALAAAAWLLWSGTRRAMPRVALDPLTMFLGANAVLIAWTTIASLQPWVGAVDDPVPVSLVRRWLPLALAFATAGTAVLARALGAEDRRRAFARHYALYLVPLALMLAMHFGGAGLVNGQLGAMYLLVAVGYALNALVALRSALDRLSDRAAALHLAGIALVAMLVLLPYHRAVMPTASDEPHYLLVTQSLLYDRDLDVRNDYALERYRAFYLDRLPDMHAVEVGSAVYSIRDLGLPILAVAPYAAGGRLGVLALMCLVGAALVAQLYLLLRDLRFTPRVAFLATATTALAHPVLTYTTQVYPELLTALVFVAAARAIRAGERASVRALVAASALAGSLPWLSTRAWPIVAGVGLVIAFAAVRPWTRDRDLRALATRLVAAGVPFATLVLALAFLNWRTFGLFLPSAGYFLIREQQPVLTYAPWIGAPGLVFDRVFGLVPRAPVYLLALVGIVPLWRRWRAGDGAAIAALALGGLLSFVYIADIAYWWADGSPPSRYLLGSIPLFVALVAGGWDVVLRGPRWARATAWAAVAASAVVAYVYAVLPNIRYDLAVDVRANGSSGALFDLLARALGVDVGPVFPSLVRLDLASVALTIGWIALAVVLVLGGWRAAARRVDRLPG